MITTQSVDALDQGLRAALAKLPDVIADMRDTAVDRERLIEENMLIRLTHAGTRASVSSLGKTAL